ncbi:MAG: hypothetical protein KDB23_26700, partial [Planctomycetales bacterium]|nr:hypothetical protein [Planctomycetales bacterium]
LIRKDEAPIHVAGRNLEPIAAPPDVTNISWGQVVIADSGELAFTATYFPHNSLVSGAWHYSNDGKLSPIAVSGMPAPGLPDRQVKQLSKVWLAENGRVFVSGTVAKNEEPRPLSVATSETHAWWSGPVGNLSLASRTSDFGISPIAMNDLGQVFDCAGGHGSAIAVLRKDQLERKSLWAGDEIPLMDSRVGQLVSISGAVGFNNSAQSAVLARATTVQRASTSLVLKHDLTSTALLLQQGMKVDGSPWPEIDLNIVLLVNRPGTVLITWRRVASIAETVSILCGVPGEPLRTVAKTQQLSPGIDGFFSSRAGEIVPGEPVNMAYSLNPFDRVVLNARGQVAFTATVRGKVSRENDAGLWASGPNGKHLELIVRTGDPVEVAAGDVRTIRNIAFAGPSGNEDARASGMNDHGQIACVVEFTDGSRAVLQSDQVAQLSGDAPAENTKVAVDAAANEQKEKERRQTALSELAAWEPLALQQVQAAQDRFALESSDRNGLAELAARLRKEYETARDQLHQLTTELEGLPHQPDLNRRRTELRNELGNRRLIWRVLAEWPYQISTEVSDEQKAFEASTNLLLEKYEDAEDVVGRIEAVQKTLKSLEVDPLEFTTPDRRRNFRPSNRLFMRNSSGQQLKTFAEPLGSEKDDGPEVTTLVDPAADSQIAEGPLRLVRKHLGRVVKLSINANGTLQIDHYRRDVSALSESTAVTEAGGLLIAAGISEQLLYGKEDRRILLHLMNGGLDRWLVIGNRFDELGNSIASKNRSGGGGGNNESLNRRFATDTIQGRLLLSDEKFDLQLSEIVPPSRIMLVRD